MQQGFDRQIQALRQFRHATRGRGGRGTHGTHGDGGVILRRIRRTIGQPRRLQAGRLAMVAPIRAPGLGIRIGSQLLAPQHIVGVIKRGDLAGLAIGG
ncbi:hypothetical protein D3C72_1906950 [compost metagenome]